MGTALKITGGVLAILAIIAMTAIAVSWYRDQHPPLASKAAFVEQQPVKEAEKIKTVYIQGPERIQVIEKPIIIERVGGLPADVKENPDRQITATAEIPPHEGKTDVVSTTDIKTGKSEILAKQRPLSFIDFESKPEIGVRLGPTVTEDDHDLYGFTVYGRWSFLRIGKAHFGLYVEANSGTEAKGQVEIGYRW